MQNAIYMYNEVNIGKPNPLVVAGKNPANGFNVKKINLISIFEMTSDFNIHNK